jgi:hypothetical protein
MSVGQYTELRQKLQIESHINLYLPYDQRLTHRKKTKSALTDFSKIRYCRSHKNSCIVSQALVLGKVTWLRIRTGCGLL